MTVRESFLRKIYEKKFLTSQDAFSIIHTKLNAMTEK